MKTQIRAGLADRIGGSSGTDPQSLDRDLLAIRASLAREIEEPFHFWSPGVRDLWDTAAVPDASPPTDEPRPRHYWLYSPGAQASEWDEFSRRRDHGHRLARDRRPRRRTRAARRSAPTLDRGIRIRVVDEERRALPVAVPERDRRRRRRLRQARQAGDSSVAARSPPTRGSSPSAAQFRHVRSVKWTHVGIVGAPGRRRDEDAHRHHVVPRLRRQARGAVRGRRRRRRRDRRPRHAGARLRPGSVPQRGLPLRGARTTGCARCCSARRT